MTEPKLDLIVLDTHNNYTLAIGDISTYPTNYNIVNPSLEITPPGFKKQILSFEEKNINVYNSYNLGLCAQSLIETTPLPDGLYTIRYSIHPAYKYSTEKTFLRVDSLQQKFDRIFVNSDIAECGLNKKDYAVLREINLDIEGAISAANTCSYKLAMELYRKANERIDNYSKNKCKSC
jgi:hypothetical protein